MDGVARGRAGPLSLFSIEPSGAPGSSLVRASGCGTIAAVGRPHCSPVGQPHVGVEVCRHGVGSNRCCRGGLWLTLPPTAERSCSGCTPCPRRASAGAAVGKSSAGPLVEGRCRTLRRGSLGCQSMLPLMPARRLVVAPAARCSIAHHRSNDARGWAGE